MKAKLYFSSDVNSEDTFVILEGVISGVEKKRTYRYYTGSLYYGAG